MTRAAPSAILARTDHFLTLEAHNPLAVALARAWYGLPYMRAKMRWWRDGDAIEYRSVRTHRGAPPVRYAVPGTFEHWLTERYALFVVDRRDRIWQGDVHHTPWPIREASLEIRTNSLAASHGIALPDTAPHVLYSPKVDTVVWSPRLATP